MSHFDHLDGGDPVLGRKTPIGEVSDHLEHGVRETADIAPFSERIAREIAKRKRKIKIDIENATFLHYPKEEVIGVLKFWGIELG